jgi:hypothetical protein
MHFLVKQKARNEEENGGRGGLEFASLAMKIEGGRRRAEFLLEEVLAIRQVGR